MKIVHIYLHCEFVHIHIQFKINEWRSRIVHKQRTRVLERVIFEHWIQRFAGNTYARANYYDVLPLILEYISKIDDITHVNH